MSISSLLDRVFRKSDANDSAYQDDVRRFAYVVAQHELGVPDAPPIDEEHLMAIVDGWGTREEFEALVRLAVDRIQAAPLAAEIDTRRSAAQAAEQAYREADEAEGRRRREALERLQELYDAIPSAQRRVDDSIEAVDLLKRTAGNQPEHRQASQRMQELAGEMRQIEAKLKPSMPPSESGYPSVGTYPGALLARARRELSELGTPGGPADTVEARSKLKETIAIAEREVGRLEKQHRKLAKHYAEATEQATLRPEHWMDPANLPARIKVAGPTADELRKQHAARMGFHNGPSVLSTIG